MATAKTKTLNAMKWLWAHRGNNIQWSPGVLTEANTKDASAPQLSQVEAVSVFEQLLERGLILKTGEVSPGNPTYILHESKVQEWDRFLSELAEQPGYVATNRKSISQKNEPDITDPQTFAGHHITKDWHHLRTAWKAVLCIAVICFVAGFSLAWKLVVESKNAAIETLQISSTDRQARLTELATENEKLSRQVGELKTYRGQDVLPLKKKALVLAQQIRDFTQGWKDTDDEDSKSENIDKYLARFGLHARIMRDDLDQNGQQSDSFDKVMYNFQNNYEDVRTIIQEIEKLAKKMPE